MLRAVALLVWLGQTTVVADSLPVLPAARVFGERALLRDALQAFRGRNMESSYAWTWSNKAIILTQFPLSSEYHVEGGIRLSMMPWRYLACLQSDNLPLDPRLRAGAMEASFLIVTQAPEGRECAVNLVKGNEVADKYDFMKQQERSETLPCAEVATHVAAFGATGAVVTHVGEVLKKPLPWNPAFDRPTSRYASPNEAGLKLGPVCIPEVTFGGTMRTDAGFLPCRPGTLGDGLPLGDHPSAW